MKTNTHKLLKQYWSYDEFRPQQEEIINSILKQQPTIGLLPTGGGKSLCFQLPALAMDSYTIVISPLIALIKDQVKGLHKVKIPASGISYEMPNKKIREVYDSCVSGEIKLLYISPERLNSEAFKSLIRKHPPSMLIVDEAHCISQWGHDFRPAYLNIYKIKKILPELTIHAFTATADKRVLNDITTYLDMTKARIYRKSYRRENLSFNAMKTQDKNRSLSTFLGQYPGTSIVYVRSRKRTEMISKQLNEYGFNAAFYHAGMPVEERDRIQELWMKDEIRIMVSTNAFGMGVDKADVRTVVHMDLPEDLESYYQEAGRAGRDGLDSIVLILYTERDLRHMKQKLESGLPEPVILKCFISIIRSKFIEEDTDEMEIHIDEFCDKVQLPRNQVIKLFSLIKRYGQIEFKDEIRAYAKIELYKSFKVFGDPVSMDNSLFKAILRLYERQHGNSYRFMEDQLAEYLGLNRVELLEQLEGHSRKGHLSFTPSTESVRIKKSGEISMSDVLKKYKRYRKNKLRKAKFMQDMVQLNLCRQLYILRYFGEHKAKACKKCDICQKNKRENYGGKEFRDFCLKLEGFLKTGPVEVDSLMRILPYFEQEKHAAMLQEAYFDGLIKTKGKLIYLNEREG